MKRDDGLPMEIHLDEEEFERYMEFVEELQKANCLAEQFLLMLCHDAGGPEHRHIRAQIRTLAHWMNLWMDMCERIAAGTSCTNNLTVNIHVETNCLRCHRHGLEEGKVLGRQRPQRSGVLLGADKAWSIQVEALIKHTSQVGLHMFARERSYIHFRGTECLTELLSATRRQQRHLDRLGATLSTMKVLLGDPRKCSTCGGPVEQVGEVSSADLE